MSKANERKMIKKGFKKVYDFGMGYRFFVFKKGRF